ncbi:MAG: polyprenyl synthetase family protein [candidate division WOR-3 bacterium]|nr:MAG: polyprenyl synthetase family protein [candidate division WOR-3 bacterium]
MRNIDVTEYLAHNKRLVDAALGKFFPDENPLFEIMYYSVENGKRIRPILAMASYEANGGRDMDVIMPIACGLELIHTYSLIHDDLPAMDDDDFRRGKAAAHKKFGEAVAILSGDGLYAYAFDLFCKGDGLVAEKLAVVRAVSEAVGPSGVVYGQMLDIGDTERLPKTMRSIHLNKTAKFIAVAIEVGAIMAKAPEDKIRKLHEAGICLGVLFQYTDDILDVVGVKHLLGKTPGKDQASGKVSAPAVYGIEGARFRAKRYADLTKRKFSALGSEFDIFCRITDFVLRRSC